VAQALRRRLEQEECAMAKDPREQQKSDAERVPAQGTGKLDQDLDRIVEKERERQERPDDPGAPLPPA
jgi:hypothetical protein